MIALNVVDEVPTVVVISEFALELITCVLIEIEAEDPELLEYNSTQLYGGIRQFASLPFAIYFLLKIDFFILIIF